MNQQEKMDRIEAARQKLNDMKTPNGAYTKATLKSLGVSWPPKKGWKKALIVQMAGLELKQPEPTDAQAEVQSDNVKKIIDTTGCSTCGAKRGEPCTQNGKARKRNHHARLVEGQAMLSEKRKGKAAKSRPKPATKSRRKAKDDGFYSSWEWKRVRYEALNMHGRRCQCCGWQPGDTKHGRLVVDHIKPRSKYPELALDVSNAQILCNDCNMGKSNVYEDDFRHTESWLSSIANED